MWYAYKQDSSHMFYAIPTDKVKEIIALNAENKNATQLEDYAEINQGKSEDTNYNTDDFKQIND